MVKTKEELNAPKEEVVTLNEKLHELSEEELTQVTGGGVPDIFLHENQDFITPIEDPSLYKR